MLNGNLVLVRVSKERVAPRFLDRDHPGWLDAAESLLLIFRNSEQRTRGEIEDEIEALIGEGGGYDLLVHRGMAKVLEDRAQFEVVADVAPESVRETVFALAAAERLRHRGTHARVPFNRDAILQQAATQMGLDPEQIEGALFADLKDENRMIAFDDLSAQALVDRYNVALVQAVLLRACSLRLEVRSLPPATARQLFRSLKFHRLLCRVEGSMSHGYRIDLDGPLNLFSSTTKYGIQLANFFPTILLCPEYRLQAELRWGPKREPKSMYLDERARLISHAQPQGHYIPEEIRAFVERFRQVAPQWDVHEVTDLVELGNQGVWVPDYRFVHRDSGRDVFVDILGFWKRSSLDRLLQLLPAHGPPRYVLAISDRLKVDESAIAEIAGPVLRFKEVPNANELRALLESLVR